MNDRTDARGADGGALGALPIGPSDKLLVNRLIGDDMLEYSGIGLAEPVAADSSEGRRARQKVTIFLVLVATFSAAIDLLRLFVGYGTNLIVLTWTPSMSDALEMCSVGLAGFITLAAVDHSFRDIGFARSPAEYLILAVFVPLTYCAAIYVPVWIVGLGVFGGAPVLLAGLKSALVHLPLKLLFAAGEEFGWRGVLVPNLAKAMDVKYAALLPGAIWAVWHYPSILFFGYNANTSPLFALVCFSVALIGLGIFLSWLRLASKSVWPAVVLHGVHNAVIWSIFERATDHGAITAYITTEFGLGFAVAGAVIGCLFWTKLRAFHGEIKAV